jgi:hypothetical protein
MAPESFLGIHSTASDVYSAGMVLFEIVVYHVRDIIKAALAEALDQEVLERNVGRKTVIPEIEERDKPILPVEWYAKLLAGLETSRDRAIFLISSFCALRLPAKSLA